MDRAFTLAIAGDVMLGRLVNEAIAARGSGYPWGNVLPILKQADLFLINLECALTARTRPWHDGATKAFYFRADPAVAATLRIGRVGFACLANNHICDFEAEGMRETVEVLDREGIAHAGAGMDVAAARAPARLTLNGVRISVLASADHPFTWAATPTSPGINYTPISVELEQFAAVEGAIAAARQGADLVIFSIHWGPNMRSRPTAAFRDFAHKVIDAGADIFWGHSAHLVQGIELCQGKLILYDTGDFVDDYTVDPQDRNDLSALFLVRVRPPVIDRLDLVPVKIADMQVNLARGEEHDWFVRRITALCTEMGTAVTIGEWALSIPTRSEHVIGKRQAGNEPHRHLRPG